MSLVGPDTIYNPGEALLSFPNFEPGAIGFDPDNSPEKIWEFVKPTSLRKDASSKDSTHEAKAKGHRPRLKPAYSDNKLQSKMDPGRRSKVRAPYGRAVNTQRLADTTRTEIDSRNQVEAGQSDIVPSQDDLMSTAQTALAAHNTFLGEHPDTFTESLGPEHTGSLDGPEDSLFSEHLQDYFPGYLSSPKRRKSDSSLGKASCPQSPLLSPARIHLQETRLDSSQIEPKAVASDDINLVSRKRAPSTALLKMEKETKRPGEQGIRSQPSRAILSSSGPSEDLKIEPVDFQGMITEPLESEITFKSSPGESVRSSSKQSPRLAEHELENGAQAETELRSSRQPAHPHSFHIFKGDSTDFQTPFDDISSDVGVRTVRETFKVSRAASEGDAQAPVWRPLVHSDDFTSKSPKQSERGVSVDRDSNKGTSRRDDHLSRSTVVTHRPGTTSNASGLYRCSHAGCNAAPFQTQYLLNSHANVHSQDRPFHCPEQGCPRGIGGRGFKRKNEMIRHGLVHDSPGYTCPFCPDREHKYPRPDNLQRHVRVHHGDKGKDDPALRRILSQRPEGGSRRRKRGG